MGYMALHYPLLFPYGQDGWYPNIPFNGVVLQDADADLDEDHVEEFGHHRKHRNVTMADFTVINFNIETLMALRCFGVTD